MTGPAAERLRRVEQQLRTLGELQVRELNALAERVGAGAPLGGSGVPPGGSEVTAGGSGVPPGGSVDPSEVAQTLATIARLHADELRIVLDELRAIAAELAVSSDPAADAPTSAKRERWLAEQERRAHPPPLSRRQLLGGRAEGTPREGEEPQREP